MKRSYLGLVFGLGYLFMASESLAAMQGELSESYKQHSTTKRVDEKQDDYQRGLSLWQEGKLTEAFKEIEKAANQGNVFALYDISSMYANGTGTEKDPSMYFEYCKKAAEAGSLLARNQLGVIYEFGVKNGEEYAIEKDEKKAVENYFIAAEAGLEFSLRNLERILGEEEEAVAISEHQTTPSKTEIKSEQSTKSTEKGSILSFIEDKVENKEVAKQLYQAHSEGLYLQKKETALRALKKGQNISDVAEISGISIQEVKQIKEQLQKSK